MAKISKNEKTGLYQTRVYIGRDENGKQIFKYLSDNSLKGLKAKIRQVEDDIANGNLSIVVNFLCDT